MIILAFKRFIGIICALLICLNTLIHGLIVFIFGGLAFIFAGGKAPPRPVQHFVSLFPTSWALFNFLIFKITTFGKWDIQGPSDISRKEWYILISNHQSWMDIIVLAGVFCLKAPPIKFFMKKQLLWTLPLAGVCCYLLGYPFMERHTRADIRKNPSLKGKDIETTKKACDKFKTVPATVINFLEGTRFTKEKHAKQQSPFTNLLKPKAGGTAIVMNELHQELRGILNVTVNYDTDDVSFLNLVSGNLKKISVHYEILPITEDLLGNYYEDRAYRGHIQRWFNAIWERKDQLLQKLNSHDT